MINSLQFQKAKSIIESWNHFSNVNPIPTLPSETSWWDLPSSNLPAWLRVGRLASESFVDITQLHSALMIVFSPSERAQNSAKDQDADQALIYTPHGLPLREIPQVLLQPPPSFQILALLHGLHRIYLSHPLATAIVGPQLVINMGAENGYQLAEALGAKYWISTHDEEKRGEGIVGKVLERRVWTADEVMKSRASEGKKKPEIVRWVDVRNGECLVLK